MVGYSYVLMVVAAALWLYFRIALARPWHNFLFVILISLCVLPNMMGIYQHPFVQQILIPLIVGMAAGDFSFRLVFWIIVKMKGEEMNEKIKEDLYNRGSKKKAKAKEKDKLKDLEAKNKAEEKKKEQEREKRRLERQRKREEDK
jgi:hypothetical protein